VHRPALRLIRHSCLPDRKTPPGPVMPKYWVQAGL